MTTLNTLKSVNYVVAVGSVDGVCTAAAVLRNTAPEAEISFCQAFTVSRLNPSEWASSRRVLFVDLAVNNRDEQMTADFIRSVADAGHTIVGVCDEHNAEDWRKAFAAAGLSFDDLAIKPVSGKGTDTNSSGALLLSLLGEDADEHTRELCEAADAGDKMDFTTHFGGMVNAAVKSKIQDDTRRVHLARHLTTNRDADGAIQGWLAEYDQILANHEEIVAAKTELGGGLVRVVTADKAIDMTTFMSGLYSQGYRVVVVDGLAFNPATKQKERQIAFGCAPNVKADLVAALKDAGITASGFAQKANVSPDDEERATAIVKAAIATA